MATASSAVPSAATSMTVCSTDVLGGHCHAWDASTAPTVRYTDSRRLDDPSGERDADVDELRHCPSQAEAVRDAPVRQHGTAPAREDGGRVGTPPVVSARLGQEDARVEPDPATGRDAPLDLTRTQARCERLRPAHHAVLMDGQRCERVGSHRDSVPGWVVRSSASSTGPPGTEHSVEDPPQPAVVDLPRRGVSPPCPASRGPRGRARPGDGAHTPRGRSAGQRRRRSPRRSRRAAPW